MLDLDFVGNVKSGGVAYQVQKITGKTLRKFCKENDLSYMSVAHKKYYSKKTLDIFKKYGIKTK